MVVGWSEGLFRHRPPRRKNDEVCDGCAWLRRLACEDCEDGRILEKKKKNVVSGDFKCEKKLKCKFLVWKKQK